MRTIEINQNVYAANDAAAQLIRDDLKKRRTFFLNVMSSPGSGKTTLLSALIPLLKSELRIGVMDVDIRTDMDARRVAESTGVPALQIHNGGLCHIDADMTARAIREFGIDGLDMLILENIGNLVCPAEFDTGAHKNMMILSVPEGDDKPLKYPLMFSVCDLVVISKTDTMEYFDFDMEKAEVRIHRLNPKAVILPVSAKTGAGMDALRRQILNLRNETIGKSREEQ